MPDTIKGALMSVLLTLAAIAVLPVRFVLWMMPDDW